MPKIALTKSGGAFLTLGTTMDTNGNLMVRTMNPSNSEDGVGEISAADFARQISLVEEGRAAKGTLMTTVSRPSRLPENAQYTFNGYLLDPQSQRLVVSLSDSHGTPVLLSSNDYAQAFGFMERQSTMRSSLSAAVRSQMSQVNVGGQSGGIFSISPFNDPGSLQRYLQSQSLPLIAYDSLPANTGATMN